MKTLDGLLTSAGYPRCLGGAGMWLGMLARTTPREEDNVSAGAKLDYHVVDVFTDRAFAGNPLAVVLGAEELNTVQMQQMANEFHLSETTFPLFGGDLRGADYQLRIFTPEVELPFAGHPSIGTAWLLRSLRRIKPGGASQLCGAGVLALEVAEDSAIISGGEPMFGEPVDPMAAVRAVGLAESDLAHAPIAVASTGLPYVVVPVQPSALARCVGDIAALREPFGIVDEMTGVFVVAWDDEPTMARARMFAGDIGAVEDPATGSAALAYGAYLVGAGLVSDGETTIEISQGVELGRPSQLRVTVLAEAGRVVRTQVSGQVVPVASGTISVPDPR